MNCDPGGNPPGDVYKRQLIACVIGNILGYSFFKNTVATLYYGSYSLPTYKTLWNPEAFLLSTLGPEIIMILINFLALYKKLKLSPLAFLRGQTAKEDVYKRQEQLR